MIAKELNSDQLIAGHKKADHCNETKIDVLTAAYLSYKLSNLQNLKRIGTTVCVVIAF